MGDYVLDGYIEDMTPEQANELVDHITVWIEAHGLRWAAFVRPATKEEAGGQDCENEAKEGENGQEN